MKIESVCNFRGGAVGFGTYKMSPDEAYSSVKQAIQLGYRYIDSAYSYFNEYGTGRAIKELIENGSVTREELFVVSKVRSGNDLGYYNTLSAVKESLQNLQLDYLDLVLIHTPHEENPDWRRLCIDTWCALEKLVRDGKIRHIGVSNYKVEHLQYLIERATIRPSVDQIEYHPFCQQRELVAYCKRMGIQPLAWSSLNQGGLISSEWTSWLCEKYGKSIAQIMLRWAVMHNIVPLISSKNKSHMKENLEIFDFTIDESDMKCLDSLDSGINRYNQWVARRETKENITSSCHYLFGFLPLLKCISPRANKHIYKLFGILPVWKIKK